MEKNRKTRHTMRLVRAWIRANGEWFSGYVFDTPPETAWFRNWFQRTLANSAVTPLVLRWYFKRIVSGLCYDDAGNIVKRA